MCFKLSICTNCIGHLHQLRPNLSNNNKDWNFHDWDWEGGGAYRDGEACGEIVVEERREAGGNDAVGDPKRVLASLGFTGEQEDIADHVQGFQWEVD